MAPGSFRWGAVLVLVVAAWARLARYPDIFQLKGGRPVGGDSAFHLHNMRRILETGSLPPWEPMMAWPEGTLSLWAPGFDWLGASFARGAFFVEAEVALLFFPVALALLATAVLMGVTLRLRPDRPGVALAAGLLFALLPQSVAVGMLGRSDHHVLEALQGAVLLLFLARTNFTPTSTVVLAAVLFGFLWCFNGGIVQVALFGMALALRVLLGGRGQGEWAAFLSAGVALAGVFPTYASAHGSWLGYAHPSWLQPLALGLGGLGLLGLESAKDGFRSTSSRRWLLPGLCLGGSAVLLVVLGAELLTGAKQFLGSSGNYLATNSELQSILRDGLLYRYWGAAGYALAPAAVVSLLWPARTESFAWPRHLSVHLFLMGLVLLAVNQNRFGRTAVVAVAVLTALGLGRLSDRFGPRRGLVMVLLTAVLLADPRLSSRLMPELRGVPAIHELSAALPRLDAPIQKGERQGVLAQWEDGFTVLHRTRRPILSSGFGPFTADDGYALEQGAWLGGLSDLEGLMEARDLGYVITGYRTFRPLSSPHGSPLTQRGQLVLPYVSAHPASSLILGGGGSARHRLPHVPFLRPIVASSKRLPGTQGTLRGPAGAEIPEAWAYEWVPGVVLEGRTRPLGVVLAQVIYRLGQDVLPYEAWTEAGGDGHFSLRLPVHGPVQVQTEGWKVALEVTPDNVRAGTRLSVGPAQTSTVASP